MREDMVLRGATLRDVCVVCFVENRHSFSASLAICHPAATAAWNAPLSVHTFQHGAHSSRAPGSPNIFAQRMKSNILRRGRGAEVRRHEVQRARTSPEGKEAARGVGESIVEGKEVDLKQPPGPPPCEHDFGTTEEEEDAVSNDWGA